MTKKLNLLETDGDIISLGGHGKGDHIDGAAIKMPSNTMGTFKQAERVKGDPGVTQIGMFEE